MVKKQNVQIREYTGASGGSKTNVGFLGKSFGFLTRIKKRQKKCVGIYILYLPANDRAFNFLRF